MFLIWYKGLINIFIYYNLWYVFWKVKKKFIVIGIFEVVLVVLVLGSLK